MNQHSVLRSETFSKIIFNFPHVGGKMKIHLNRNLLKDFFENISPFLKSDGRVLVSLCKGQGGTAADVSRHWENSWQIVEMAAHGDFILCAIEPFLHYLVPDYTSVGYRSRDEAFHTDNALVHVFKKVDKLFPNPDASALLWVLEPQTIHTDHGDILCLSTYSRLYQKNLISDKSRPIPKLIQELEQTITSSGIDTRYITEEQVPIHYAGSNGSVQCSVANTDIHCELRHSLFDVIDSILPYFICENRVTAIYPGIVFNKLGHNFDLSPISNHVLFLGNDALNLCTHFLNQVLTSVASSEIKFEEIQSSSLSLPSQPNHLKVTVHGNIAISSGQSICREDTIVGQNYCLELSDGGQKEDVSACVIFVDTIAHLVYHTQNWRELWADGVGIDTINGQRVFKPASLHQQMYELDLCFSYRHLFSEECFFTVLWQIGGDIIINVSPFFNEFNSHEGWQSRCYRISYKCFDKALHRNKIIDIHHNVIGAILSEKLNVKMH